MASEPSDIGIKGTCTREAVYDREIKPLFLPSGALGGLTTAEHEARAQMLAAGIPEAGPTHSWGSLANSSRIPALRIPLAAHQENMLTVH